MGEVGATTDLGEEIGAQRDDEFPPLDDARVAVGTMGATNDDHDELTKPERFWAKVNELAKKSEHVSVFYEKGTAQHDQLENDWNYRVRHGAYLDPRHYNIEKAVHRMVTEYGARPESPDARGPETKESGQKFLVKVGETPGRYGKPFPMLRPVNVKELGPEDMIAVEKGTSGRGYKLMSYGSW